MAANQGEILVTGDVLALKQFSDLQRLQRRPLLQVRGLQGFHHRKAGLLEPPLELIGLALLQLSAHQIQQKAFIVCAPFSGLTGTFLVVSEHRR